MCASPATTLRFRVAAALVVVGGLTVSCGGAPGQNPDSLTSSRKSGEKSVSAGTTPTDSRGEVRAARDDVSVDEGDGATPSDVVAMPADTPQSKPSRPANKRGKAKSDPASGALRSKLSAFLVPLARDAAKSAATRGKAVSLYRGLVAARGPGDPIALELARTYRVAEDYSAAAAVYRAFAAETNDRAAAADARAEADEVDAQPTPFSRSFAEQPALAEARKVWNKGRKASRRKKWDEALVYYQMAAGLAPEMPGPMRELGTVYRKLDRPEQARSYFHAYLRRRPVGKIANEVRKQLNKDDTLGRVTVTGTKKLRCEQVWVQGLFVSQKLPIKSLALPEGRYRWLCFNNKYGLAYYKWVDVPRGGQVEANFRWAIVVNALKKPYGRVRIEDARNPDVMQDLGLALNEVGVPVPDDGRALRVKLISDDRSRIEDRLVKLSAGERTVIKW